jgi:hypothetical protein
VLVGGFFDYELYRAARREDREVGESLSAVQLGRPHCRRKRLIDRWIKIPVAETIPTDRRFAGERCIHRKKRDGLGYPTCDGSNLKFDPGRS